MGKFRIQYYPFFPSLPSDSPILVSSKSESSAPKVVLELGVAADQNCFAPPCKIMCVNYSVDKVSQADQTNSWFCDASCVE